MITFGSNLHRLLSEIKIKTLKCCSVMLGGLLISHSGRGFLNSGSYLKLSGFIYLIHLIMFLRLFRGSLDLFFALSIRAMV